MTMRKKEFHERRLPVAFTLDQDVIEWIDDETKGGSRSEWLNVLLRNHMSEERVQIPPGASRLDQVEDILKEGGTAYGTKSDIKSSKELKTIEVIDVKHRKRGRPRKDKNDAIKRLEQELRK